MPPSLWYFVMTALATNKEGNQTVTQQIFFLINQVKTGEQKYSTPNK